MRNVAKCHGTIAFPKWSIQIDDELDFTGAKFNLKSISIVNCVFTHFDGHGAAIDIFVRELARANSNKSLKSIVVHENQISGLEMAQLIQNTSRNAYKEFLSNLLKHYDMPNVQVKTLERLSMRIDQF
jgi:TRAP-type mannitol/chloroaromatic compound transport system substrate-binding protein